MGEITVRSKHIMLEYRHKPDDTRDNIVNSWLHTGDMGCYDEEGYIYIVNRKKDMIIKPSPVLNDIASIGIYLTLKCG